MKTSVAEFRNNPHKRITLMGMSGVGKTRLANILRGSDWFHYSVDYRIGTRYLDEAILDNIKFKAMQTPFIRDLLVSDSIYISNNITFDNLKPLSTWLGKLGDPDKDGLPLDEFKLRQALHLAAEKSAMRDIPSFIQKSKAIYGYSHFLNDVSGSLCELDNEALLEELAANTLIIYLEADEDDEARLKAQAMQEPKPLYYREAFLDEKLAAFLQEKNYEYVTQVDPDEFVRWVFPHLFNARLPRYQAIVKKYGYSISARDALEVNNEKAFLELVESAIAIGN